MNRSLTNVLFGGISTPAVTDHKMEGEIKQTSVDETVESLANAESVIIVGATHPSNQPSEHALCCCKSLICRF